jgi:hypothetical protein
MEPESAFSQEAWITSRRRSCGRTGSDRRARRIGPRPASTSAPRRAEPPRRRGRPLAQAGAHAAGPFRRLPAPRRPQRPEVSEVATLPSVTPPPTHKGTPSWRAGFVGSGVSSVECVNHEWHSPVLSALGSKASRVSLVKSERRVADHGGGLYAPQSCRKPRGVANAWPPTTSTDPPHALPISGRSPPPPPQRMSLSSFKVPGSSDQQDTRPATSPRLGSPMRLAADVSCARACARSGRRARG